jgi:hypothetical protein
MLGHPVWLMFFPNVKPWISRVINMVRKKKEENKGKGRERPTTTFVCSTQNSVELV